MPNLTQNESFQLWQDNEAPWEHRSDFEKLDNIFGGARTVSAFATDGLDYNSLTPDYRLSGPWVQSQGATSNQTTTNTSYTKIYDVAGAMDVSDIPTNATLYGRFYMLMKISNSSSTVFARPRVTDENGNGGTTLTELEISHTGDTNFDLADSGWTEITSSISGIVTGSQFEGKVSADTGTYSFVRQGLVFAGVESTA